MTFCVLQCSAAAAEAEEEDDWEEKADQTPRGPALSAGAQASTSGRKVYTLDWLVKQQNLPQCHEMPNVEQYPELLEQNWQARAGPMVSLPQSHEFHSCHWVALWS